MNYKTELSLINIEHTSLAPTEMIGTSPVPVEPKRNRFLAVTAAVSLGLNIVLSVLLYISQAGQM